MADDPKTDPTPTPDPPAEPDAAESYWKEFESRLDGWFDKKVKTLRDQQGPGTSRTGRSTFPKILADLMGGPFTPKAS